MENLIISGAVTDRGNPLSDSIAIGITLSLWRADTGFMHTHGIDLITDDDGKFSFSYAVSDEIISEFNVTDTSASGLMRIDLLAYAQGAISKPFESIVMAFESLGQTFIGVANNYSDNLEYDIDLSDLNRYIVAAILNGDDVTQEAFEDVDSMWCEIFQIFQNPFGDVSFLPEFGFPVTGSTAFRSLSIYQAIIFVNPTNLEDGEFFVRFTSNGPDFLNDLTVRTFAMTDTWTNGFSDDRWGIVVRVDETIGIGTLSAGFDDRIFKFPILILDLDIDIVDETLRVRGDIGIGTSKDVLLKTIGSFDGLVSIEYRNRESIAFTKDEFDDLFDIDVVSLEYDLLPGTDFDEFNWVSFILGVGSLAALITAIEALITPLIRKQLQDKMKDALADQVKAAVIEKRDGSIDEFGITADSVISRLKAALWFEGDDVKYDPDYIRVMGWAGIWDRIVVAKTLTGDLCAFEDDDYDNQDNDNQNNNQSKRKISSKTNSSKLVDKLAALNLTKVMAAYRKFEAILKDKRLVPWMTEYKLNAAEMIRIRRHHPELTIDVAKFALNNLDIIKSGLRGILKEKAVRQFTELIMKVQPFASNRLYNFLSNILNVMTLGLGLTLQKVITIAMTKEPGGKKNVVRPLVLLGRGVTDEETTLKKAGNTKSKGKGKTVKKEDKKISVVKKGPKK